MSKMERIESLITEGAFLSWDEGQVLAGTWLTVVEELPRHGNVGEVLHVRNTGHTYICSESHIPSGIATWQEIK